MEALMTRLEGIGLEPSVRYRWGFDASRFRELLRRTQFKYDRWYELLYEPTGEVPTPREREYSTHKYL